MVLLAAFAALTFWLDRQLQPVAPAGNAKLRHDPDYIVEDISATRFGPDGAARFTLDARRMVHYPDDDTTALEAPRLVNFGINGARVTVTSKNALVSSNGENIYLRDDVTLIREAHADKDEMKVETSYLHVIPDQEIAKTDKPVQITDLHTRITSIGLEFDNRTRILNLLSNVRSTYERPTPPR
mgnify:CR=1 FL=1